MCHNYILRVGPFKGYTIEDAADLYHDGKGRVYNRETAIKENLDMSKNGRRWMGWYLSHCGNYTLVEEDRNQMAKYIINCKIDGDGFKITGESVYNSEPYITWAKSVK